MAIKTMQEFGEAILAGVRVHPDELPKVASAGWVGPNGLTFIEINKVNPLDPFSMVVGVFYDDTEIRLYTMPVVPPSLKPDTWKVRANGRMILSRTGISFVSEAYSSIDAMAQAMVDEWNAVADEVNSAEAELEAVLGYLEGQSLEVPQPSLAFLLEGLRAGEHHAEDEDDDEDEDDGEDFGGETTTDVGPKTEPAPPPSPAVVGGPASEAAKT